MDLGPLKFCLHVIIVKSTCAMNMDWERVLPLEIYYDSNNSK